MLPPHLANDPPTRERFLREARTAAQLSHPSIVPVHRADETKNAVYFVMAFVSVRVALVTCAELPAADADTRLLIEPLAALGIDAKPAVWDDAAVAWEQFDLAVVRSCWDYLYRREEFLAWAARVPRLANAHDVLAWNTDKRYLRELGAQGVAVVPTQWIAPQDSWLLPRQGEWVIKPAVSLSSLGAGRYDLDDATQHHLAAAHVERLQEAGRTVMLQQYLRAIDSEGETSLIYIEGAFSHAVRRAAVLTGPDMGLDKRFAGAEARHEVVERGTEVQLRLADRALAAVPSDEVLLYARVDLVPGADSAPVLMELELSEPSLFLGYAAGAPARFARAIAGVARRLR